MSHCKILKALPIALIFSVMIILSACGNGNGYYSQTGSDIEVTGSIDDTTLVIYTTFSSEFTAPIIELFEERYNIIVELHQDSTASTLARLRSEEQNPQADVMWGGRMYDVAPDMDLFQDFVTEHEMHLVPGHENIEGALTRFVTNAGLLIINTDLLGDIEIRGYECLLNPALYGQIAMVYPSASSLSFSHLVNQLYAMGRGHPHNGWIFVTQFITNMGGIILTNSEAVHTGVSNGDFIVGLTYEDAFLPYAEANPHVKIVYMNEGVVPDATVVGIVNGAINLEGAEAFISFVTSYEVQAFIQANLNRRSVRWDVATTGVPVANREINWIPADIEYVLWNMHFWTERFWSLWMLHN
ncbi:MAG: extracellular solute-binding protein [Defluviitaleaceae bacterium]|nr:extracellular solute-binding protein [Defluviitaleaceae bacterium]